MKKMIVIILFVAELSSWAMEGYSDDWETDFSPFTFDLAQ